MKPFSHLNTVANLLLALLAVIWGIKSYNASLHANQLALAANQIAFVTLCQANTDGGIDNATCAQSLTAFNNRLPDLVSLLQFSSSPAPPPQPTPPSGSGPNPKLIAAGLTSLWIVAPIWFALIAATALEKSTWAFVNAGVLGLALWGVWVSSGL